MQRFVGSNMAIGCALLRFASVDERDRLMAAMSSHLAVQVE